jgi:cytochrome c5
VLFSSIQGFKASKRIAYTCAPCLRAIICGANVSANDDAKFMNHFSLVLGILVAIAIGLFAMARMVGAATQLQHVRAEQLAVTAVDARTQPFAHVAVAGADNSALAATEEPAGAAPAAAAPPKTGEEVYNAACVACHGAGIGGAPKFGDKSAWASHVSKGIEVLHTHAIEGFQGPNGLMPPKGGRADLPDEVIRLGVDYMVEHSR